MKRVVLIAVCIMVMSAGARNVITLESLLHEIPIGDVGIGTFTIRKSRT